MVWCCVIRLCVVIATKHAIVVAWWLLQQLFLPAWNRLQLPGSLQRPQQPFPIFSYKGRITHRAKSAVGAFGFGKLGLSCRPWLVLHHLLFKELILCSRQFRSVIMHVGCCNSAAHLLRHGMHAHINVEKRASTRSSRFAGQLESCRPFLSFCRVAPAPPFACFGAHACCCGLLASK